MTAPTEALGVLMSDEPEPMFVRATTGEPDAVEAARVINEILANEPETRARIRHEAMLAAFVHGSPVPAPPRQDWPYARIVRRSIAGDDEDLTPRAPSLRGFIAAMAASGDWGVPVRSTCDPDRFGKGGVGGGGGRPHDPHVGREHYALAERELRRIADELPTKTTRLGVSLDGYAQLAIWCTVAGAGQLLARNLHADAENAYTQALASLPERRAKYAERMAVREKRLAEGVSPRSLETPSWPGEPTRPPKPVFAPDRKAMTATDVSLALRERGVDLSKREVSAIAREITRIVGQRFAAKGWVREQTKRERAEGETTVAAPAGYDVESWKEVAPIIGRSEDQCQRLARRKGDPLPVRWYLGRIVARREDLLAWINRQTLTSSHA